MSLFFAGDRAPSEVTSPAAISTAGGLVAGRFELASAYASDLWSQAKSLLDELGGIDYTIDWEGVDLSVVETGGLDGINAEEPSAPAVSTIDITEVEFPYTAPSPVISDIPVRTAPTPNIPDPDFSIPSPPDVTWPSLTANVPDINDIAIPTAPTLSLPSVPQLSELSIPSPPEYSIPDFEWELPTEDLTPPEPQFVYNEAEYDSDLKQALAVKLYNEITGGSTGLNEATEQAIYDRAVSRQLDEEQDKLDQILDFFASRMYDAPPGVLVNQMLEMNNKVLKAREDLNNDILIQQSKLAQTNTHFIITASIENEKLMMEYINQFQNRALDVAKFVVTGALAIYSTKVETYKAKLIGYTALAEVYKARITGEVAKAEFYKAQMTGVYASAEVQKAQVAIYSAQVEAAKIWIELFKAEMEGANLEAEVDKVKIASYATLVQAYSAQVTASSERYRGYQAQIAGEVAKADLYKSMTQAYTARVDAYKTEVEADTLVLQQSIEINKNEIEVFKSRIQKYVADIQAAVSNVESQVKAEGLKVDLFKALEAGYAAELDALTKVFMGKVEQAKAQADIEIKEGDILVRQALGKYDLLLKSMTAAATVAAQMAASAIAGVSASANLQHGEHRSDARSGSISENYSASDISQASISVQNIYMHES